MIERVGHLAIVQPRVGIGDMIWHLPHLRALARANGGRVTLVARPRSHAAELVGANDGIADIFWVERDQWIEHGRHQGFRGFARLVVELRGQRFDAAVLLTRSRVLAGAMMAAGVRHRYGYGVGSQRLLLNRGPPLPASALASHPFEQAGIWLSAAGVPLPDPEPHVTVSDEALRAARARLGGLADRPYVTLGIGASDAWKNWGPAAFANLARRLLDAGWPAIVLVGGEVDVTDAAEVTRRLESARVVAALGWHLREVAGVLAGAAFCVANDTAVLNLAAAVGTRAYGLFGATPVLRHSAVIVPILGQPTGGMASIGVASVMATIAADRAPIV